MQVNSIRYLSFTGIHPAHWSSARFSELPEYTPKLHEAGMDSIKVIQELVSTTSPDEITSLFIPVSDSDNFLHDENQVIYSDSLGPNTINRSRKALFNIYKAVANDPAFLKPIDSIVQRYIEFNQIAEKIFKVSFGSHNGQFDIPNKAAYDELSPEAKKLIRTTILMREMRGLTHLSHAEVNGTTPSWDSVLVHDRLSRSAPENHASQFDALKKLQTWDFPGFAKNFARSIAYKYDPIARLFIDSTHCVIGPNSDSLISSSDLNWDNIQTLSAHFNSRMTGFGLTAQEQGIFPTILLLEDKQQKDFLLRPRTRSETEGEGISSIIVLDGLTLLSTDEKQAFNNGRTTESGGNSTGGTGAATVRLPKDLQAIVFVPQSEAERKSLAEIENILKGLSNLPNKIKHLPGLITPLINQGNFDGAIKIIKGATDQLRSIPQIETHFNKISQRLQTLIKINKERSPVQVITVASNTNKSSTQKNTKPILVPIALNSIPGLDEYKSFWGAYPNDTLQSFVDYCNNTDIASPISVNQTLLRNLLHRSSGVDRLPENHIEIFLGQANSQETIHRQNKELLITGFKEVIAEREKRALDKLEKEKVRQTQASTKSTPANNVTGKTKRSKSASAIPPINDDSKVSAQVTSVRITQGDSQAKIRLALMANKELGPWINNPQITIDEIVREGLAFHERVIQAIINPYASFNSFQEYCNSPEYAAIQEMGGIIQFPELTSESEVLASAESQGLNYLQSLKSFASENNVEWEIPVLQKLNGVEELDKLQSWCNEETSDKGNNVTAAHQKAFFKYLSTRLDRLDSHKLSMELLDTPYKLIVKNKKINLSEPLFERLQSEYQNVEAILANKRDLTATEFKVLCSALEYILDYESLVLDMKDSIPILQNELKNCKKMNELPDELKEKLTSLVDRFNTFPIPKQICDKLIKNMPFSYLLNHAWELTASYNIAIKEGDFAAPYSTLPVSDEEFIPNEEDELQNISSVEEIITPEELATLHIFTHQVLNKFLEKNETVFVHRGDERLIQTIRYLQQKEAKTVERKPRNKPLSVKELLQMLPQGDDPQD